jgi:hypothetical protein
MLTKVRTFIDEEISLLTVLYFPFPELSVRQIARIRRRQTLWKKRPPRERLCRTGSDPSRAAVWLRYQDDPPGPTASNHYKRSNTTPYSGFMPNALPAKNLATGTRLANCRPICASHVSRITSHPFDALDTCSGQTSHSEFGSIISSLIFRT